MSGISIKYRLLLLLGSVCVLTITYFSLFSKEDEPNVTVILRYDDYASESSTKIEKEILNVVKKYNISCSFGVIPFSQVISSSNDTTFIPIDSSKIKLIIDFVNDGSIDVCQLGYSHSDLDDGDLSTEFLGLPLNQQLNKIASAKNVLDTAFRINTRTFIPTWHSYDQVTVDALSKLEFQNISGDNKEKGIDHSNLNLIPMTMYVIDFENLLERRALPFDGQNAVLVWLLNDYDFQEVNPARGFTNLEEFNSTIDKLIEQDWKIISIENALNNFNVFDSQHYKLNRIKLLVLDHLKPLIKFPVIFNKLGIVDNFYLSASHVNRLILATVIYYICLLLVVIELIILVSRQISIKVSGKKIILYLAVLLILVFAVIFWFDDQTYGKNELLLILFFTGLFLGMLPVKKATD